MSIKTKSLNVEQYYHYIVPPIDDWTSSFPLSAISNREGRFSQLTDTKTKMIEVFVQQCLDKVGGCTLRHEPHVEFESTSTLDVNKVYIKIDENGITHIFSKTEMGTDEIDNIMPCETHEYKADHPVAK